MFKNITGKKLSLAGTCLMIIAFFLPMGLHHAENVSIFTSMLEYGTENFISIIFFAMIIFSFFITFIKPSLSFIPCAFNFVICYLFSVDRSFGIVGILILISGLILFVSGFVSLLESKDPTGKS